MARKAKVAAGAMIAAEDEEIKRMIASVPIEVWPIDDVILDPNNANIHDRRSIDDIKGSIAKFGQVEPLLIRKSTSIMIAGEGRWVAMKELGYAHVEVRPLDFDATAAAMLSLALNRTAEHSHFDFENVAAQLKGFKADGHDISILGWADFELEPLLAGEWKPPSVEPKSSPNGKKDDGTHPHAVIFSEEQWPVILDAVNRVRGGEQDPTIKENRALELIVGDWLSRN
jgi:hypothetical protein